MDKPTVINLNEQRIDESWMRQFGTQVKYMIDQMGFGGMVGGSNLSIRGMPSQIQSFAGALMGERAHMQAATRYGLTDPKTYASRLKLDRAVKNFERATGIKYPVG